MEEGWDKQKACEDELSALSQMQSAEKERTVLLKGSVVRLDERAKHRWDGVCFMEKHNFKEIQMYGGIRLNNTGSAYNNY